MQILQADITWKPCAQLPTRSDQINAVVINGVVYYGADTIYCYDPSQDKWTEPLPSPPVKFFGLGQINGKLVTVGGEKKRNETANEVYTYEESLRSRKWKQAIPPMPTARWYPGVLSLQSVLVVVGGQGVAAPSNVDTTIVEIYKPDTSQWYRTCGLPKNQADSALPLIAIGDKCYTLGGSDLNQIFFASVDDLLRYAVPAAANQITHIARHRDTKSAWKELCETETFSPAISMLAGNLLAIGGGEHVRYMGTKVYMYSPSTNSWIYVGDLPVQQAGAAVAVLSSTEILVIGGWIDDSEIFERLNSVYKGTLHLKL